MKPIVENLFKNCSSKTILATFSGEYTSRNLLDRVDFYSSLLEKENINGKRIALLVPAIPSYVALVLAINKLGGTVVPLSFQFRKEDLSSILKFINPHIVFTVDVHDGFSFGEHINKWAEELQEETTIFVSSDNNNEIWDKKVLPGTSKQLEIDEKTFIGCSSGSTGTPKGMVPKPSLFEAVYDIYPEFTDLQPGDTVLLNTPLTGLAGLSLFFHAIYSGAKVILSETFDFPKIVTLMAENECNKIISTPSIFRAIYQIAKGIQPQAIKNIKFVGLAGERVTEDYKDQFDLLDNCKFVSMYGSSEAGVIGHSVLTDKVEFTIHPKNEYKIVAGELLLKTPTTFIEYYNNPVLTEEVFNEDGWLLTGDIVQETRPGRIEIVGRKKDIIKKGGQQVVPGEIEEILMKHGNVLQAVVMGTPHKVFGEKIVAFVVLDNEQDTKELTQYCSKLIAGYKVPDKFIRVDNIPVSQGKVDKVTLRNLYSEAVKEQ